MPTLTTRLDEQRELLAAATARQSNAKSLEERELAGQAIREADYQVRNLEAAIANMRSVVPANATPAQLARRAATMDAESTAVTKAVDEGSLSPLVAAAHDQRTSRERVTIAERLPSATPAGTAPSADAKAAPAAARATFASLHATNPIAAASFAERHPHALEPDGAA